IGPEDIPGDVPPQLRLRTALRTRLLDRYWWLRPEYDRTCLEQWRLRVGSHVLSLYNYAEKTELARPQAMTIAETLARYQAYKPGVVKRIGAITITNHFPDYWDGDPRFTVHAEAFP